MANHKNAEKAHRQIVKRTAIRKTRVSRIRTFIKKVEAAIGAGDQAAANLALREAQSEMMRGVGKNILKLNTASRKISRLSSKIKKIAS